MAYSAEISRAHPTCLLFVIDQSGSMSEELEGGVTAFPDPTDNRQQQIIGTQTRGAGNGEKQGLYKGRVQRQQFNFLAGVHEEPNATRQGFLSRIRDAIKKL